LTHGCPAGVREKDMELWDAYDEYCNKTGGTLVRGERLKKGEYHLVVRVCLFNSSGKMLIQQRQTSKDGWPGMWDFTVGGAAIRGDDGRAAASRELKEELGIDHDFSHTRPHMTVYSHNSFCDIFMIEKNVRIDDLCLQQEEVKAVKWASRSEIKKMIDEGVFIPFHKSVVDLFFDVRKQCDFVNHGYGRKIKRRVRAEAKNGIQSREEHPKNNRYERKK